MRNFLLCLGFVSTLCYPQGRQESGPAFPRCPLGTEYVQFGLGSRTVATACVAMVELEREGYVIKSHGAGNVICRVLVVQSK